MNEPRPHPGDAYFASVGDALGSSYLRYSFTKGTAQEVAFLLELLDLPRGARVLDVGCGPCRHAIPLAQAGLAVTGIDVSRRLLDLGAEEARSAGVPLALFEVDARAMPFDDEFDAVISICQGAFGLMGGDDGLVLRRMTEALRSGGRLATTAFNAYFEAAHPRGAHLEIDEGIVHERTTIKTESGDEADVDLWTGVFTPRELRLLALGVGLLPEAVWGVEPGDFGRRPPSIELPELLLWARKP
ncbi:MAG TPA: class I SAM-dependent methyltransferase [Actinomycetota bacterium]|nr:class I SAM-dependent methyltransferase [Actinomycetota bacterium]